MRLSILGWCREKILTNELTRIILDLIILKGSADMYLFVTRNSYKSYQAMHNYKHGLIGVCEYFSYEEK